MLVEVDQAGVVLLNMELLVCGLVVQIKELMVDLVEVMLIMEVDLHQLVGLVMQTQVEQLQIHLPIKP